MTENRHYRPTFEITLAGAKAAIVGALGEAERQGVAITAAVVDAGGHLFALSRMDMVHAGTVAVAQAKANTAVMFKRPSTQFADALKAGNSAMLGIPNVIALPGGIPLKAGDSVVGAIGISGASPDVDEAIAKAGAAAFETAGGQ
ncbi:MAG: heme-binding protein [Hyphomicrobiaceae bacterium]|nr:heme-binding protein [Hyphomicrobiaceae bacterium]